MSSAASQSLAIYSSDSDSSIISVNGYGKDNTYYSTEICLRSTLYHVVASDRCVSIAPVTCSLRASWKKGSFFSIKALGTIELLRGSCDFGGMQEFQFYRTAESLFRA